MHTNQYNGMMFLHCMKTLTLLTDDANRKMSILVNVSYCAVLSMLVRLIIKGSVVSVSYIA